MGRRHVELRGELLLQVKGIAIGVEIDLGQRLAHGGQRQARGAEWVFIRGQLDDFIGGQPKFTRDFLNGAARLIDRNRLEVWISGKG